MQASTPIWRTANFYGGRNFTISDTYSELSIPLNATFLSNLIASAGATLALGGHISTMDGVAASAPLNGWPRFH